MNSKEIFSIALGLHYPWEVTGLEIEEDEHKGIKSFHITIGFRRGSKFRLPDGSESTSYDTVERSWQHLSLFEHPCYLHCKVPRIKDKQGKVKQVPVPWSRKGSGFTLLFEAYAMTLIEREMPVNKAADLLGIYPQRLWTIFKYWISIAYDADNQKGIRNIGIDETSVRKGHNYVTIAADMERRRVIHATKGKDQTTITKIREHLSTKGVKPEEIDNICIDMSPSFIAGIMEEFPDSSIVFDKFHIVKMLNDAMDKVRKTERKEHAILKGHKYTFLKNNRHISSEARRQREELIELLPILGEAYRLKELFNDFWDFDNIEDASGYLSFWIDYVDEKKIPPFKKFANTLKLNWSGIVNYFDADITNGVLEGINNKIQLAKRRARGFTNTDNFINMIYFLTGKLKFNYPQNFT